MQEFKSPTYYSLGAGGLRRIEPARFRVALCSLERACVSSLSARVRSTALP
eukprot:COSAG01_NODE_12946_length_1658_cov_23.967928_1_plen_50_part_01